jgi:hypothetical protein
VYILVTPLKVVDDPLICEFLFNNKDVLKKLNDPFVYIEVVELSNLRFLVLQIFFI